MVTGDVRKHAESAMGCFSKMRSEIFEVEQRLRSEVHAYRHDMVDSLTEMNTALDDIEFRLAGLIRFIDRSAGGVDK